MTERGRVSGTRVQLRSERKDSNNPAQGVEKASIPPRKTQATGKVQARPRALALPVAPASGHSDPAEMAEALAAFCKLPLNAPQDGKSKNDLLTCLRSLQSKMADGLPSTHAEVHEFKIAYQWVRAQLQQLNQAGSLSLPLKAVYWYLSILLAAPDPKKAGALLENGLDATDPLRLKPVDLSAIFPSNEEAFAILGVATEPVLVVPAKPAAPAVRPAPVVLAPAAPKGAKLPEPVNFFSLFPSEDKVSEILNTDSAGAALVLKTFKPKQQATPPEAQRQAVLNLAKQVAQDYLDQNGPKAPNRIVLKRVDIDGNGRIKALEIYKKGSKTKTKILDLEAASWKGTRLAGYLKSKGIRFKQFEAQLRKNIEAPIQLLPKQFEWNQ